MKSFQRSAAAIILAPVLRYAVHMAEQSESLPAFEDLPYEDREKWILIADASLDAIEGIRQFLPEAPAPQPTLDAALKEWKASQLRLVKGKT